MDCRSVALSAQAHGLVARSRRGDDGLFSALGARHLPPRLPLLDDCARARAHDVDQLPRSTEFLSRDNARNDDDDNSDVGDDDNNVGRDDNEHDRHDDAHDDNAADNDDRRPALRLRAASRHHASHARQHVCMCLCLFVFSLYKHSFV